VPESESEDVTTQVTIGGRERLTATCAHGGAAAVARNFNSVAERTSDQKCTEEILERMSMARARSGSQFEHQSGHNTVSAVQWWHR